MTDIPLDAVAVDPLIWPYERLPEGLELLARRARLVTSLHPPLPALPPASAALGRWLEAACSQLELEAVAVESPYGELASMLRGAAPALLRSPQGGFWLLVKGGRRRVTLLLPDLSLRRVAVEELRVRLVEHWEAPLMVQLAPVLAAVAMPSERLERARHHLIAEQLAGHTVGDCWLLRLKPGGAFGRQLQRLGIFRQLLGLAAIHALQQGLLVLSWWLILQSLLNGHIEPVWLWGWALVLVTLIPCQLVALWLQSLIVTKTGAAFKQRLMVGALKLAPEEVRHQGMGQFLGRVLESDALEALVMGGGFAALTAVVELATAALVFALGAKLWLLALALLLWTLLGLLYSLRYYQLSRGWRRSHRLLINTLVERMVGYRTRLAQQHPSQWHEEEDRDLAGYSELGRQQDRVAVQISALLERGWLLVGFLGLVYGVTVEQISSLQVAVAIGGIILAYQGFSQWLLGLPSVVGVLNAWQQVAPLYRAAGRVEQQTRGDPTALADEAEAVTSPPTASSKERDNTDQPLVLGRDLAFRYRQWGQPVINGCSFTIYRGDRILLEGASGGGKSTLAALLTGLKEPTSGLLLLRGLDRQTLGGDAWRRRVVSAPQFHDNHILAETLAFNLLMGRGWPPQRRDLQEAEEVCQALGLGPLLERMPGGLMTMVGESGWQLSHGERSRVFIARALLQGADLIILDESFAALDPENLRRCLQVVLERAPTLLVIAHP